MESQALKAPIECILLDLDDTLYPSSTGIAQACKRNIEEFLASKCGVSAERAYDLRAELFHTYGSSLTGLLALGFDVHPDEYHSYVHGRLPYERIGPDPQLAELLNSIRQPKILFTNSDREHVRRVLGRLGVGEGFFARIVCFETLNPHLFGSAAADSSGGASVVLKPSPAAMEVAVGLAGCSPRRTLFMDDSERNIAAGKALGLVTALVGKRVKTKEADYVVEGIHSARRAIPEIWAVTSSEEEEEAGKEDKEEPTARPELDSIRPPTSVEA